MLAEGAHSVADTVNQAFLLTALKRSTKPADAQHPFGYALKPIDPDQLDENLAVRLADESGIAGRHYLADAIAALPKEARGAARKGGIVFGALDIYHHAALKPAAAKWRAALFAARDSRAMPVLPPESAVHLKTWNFANPSEARNAGYRRIGDEYVRIDLAERVIKKAHEARGQNNAFGMDSSQIKHHLANGHTAAECFARSTAAENGKR